MSDETFPIPFGRYQLMERLAVGGMAELFRARVVGAHGFQKPMVIKRILPQLAVDPSFRAMFIEEAKITARLDHPKIAQVFELGTEGDQLFIAMEYVDGVDGLAVLRGYARRGQGLPPRLAVHILHEVLDALDYAHSARGDDGRPLGIVHRDVSPSNVLISRRGDVKLADFGIAHAREHGPETRTLSGKYGYMAPEQVAGSAVDARGDVFAVGTVLAEMLMGRRLFVSPNELDVLVMVRDVKLDRLEKHGAGIDPGLRRILLHALEREPGERIPSAAVFRDLLEEWLFQARQRVSSGDLAAVVEQTLAEGRAHAPGTPSNPSAFSSPSLAGPTTAAAAEREIERTRRRRAAPPDIDVVAEPPPAAVPATARPRETLDIPIEVEEPVAETAPLAIDIDAADEAQPAAPGPALEVLDGPADMEGSLEEHPPIQLLARLAAARATGLLVAESGEARKDVYVVDGKPEYVVSNLRRELLGEYLVGQKILSEGELAMALAMIGSFQGRLGDTLVGLGLMKPLEVFRYLLRQVRDRVVELCTWPSGRFRFFNGKKTTRAYFRLGLDPFELLGLGARALPPELVAAWAQPHFTARLAPIVPPRVPPESFRLGTAPRDLFDRLDGQSALGDLASRYDVEGRLEFLRLVYLLYQAEVVTLA